MRKSGSWRVGRWAIALGSMAAFMATAPSANATITSVFSNTAAPMGGYKRSGNGREMGVFGLEEFLEVKAMIGFEEPAAA